MKKFILGTVFTSSVLLLGATGQKADAATSSLKNLDKTVTVTKDNVRLYSDSKLKKATKVKDGTVYDVNGYRVINGKKYYRVYQKGYKGYLKATDAKDLKAKKESKKVTYAKDYTRWSNLFFNGKKGTLNDKNYYEVKYSYTLGNGVKYYSLYAEGKDGKSTWQGYVNSKAIRELKATSYGKNISVKSGNYKLWSSFYFNKDKGTAKKGKVYSAERYYKLGNGRKYYSLYEIKADGSKKWAGYVNADATQAMKSTNVADKEMQVKTATTAWGAQEKRSSVKKGTQVIVKRYYKGTDGKKYYSAYTTADKWLGYICESDLTTPSKPSKPSTDKPAEKPNDSSNTGNTGSSSEEKPSKPDTGNSGDTTKPSEPSKPEEKPSEPGTEDSSMLKPNGPSKPEDKPSDDDTGESVDKSKLESAIEAAKRLDNIDVKSNIQKGSGSEVGKEYDLAQDVLKSDSATQKAVDQATHQLENSFKELKLNKDGMSRWINKMVDKVKAVYMSIATKDKIKSALNKSVSQVREDSVTTENYKYYTDLKSEVQDITEGMTKLPDKKDYNYLKETIDEANQVLKYSRGNGEVPGLVYNDTFDNFKKDVNIAVSDLEDLDNQSRDLSRKEVEVAAGNINNDMFHLKVNITKAQELAKKAQESSNQNVKNLGRGLMSTIKNSSFSNWENIAMYQKQVSKALESNRENGKLDTEKNYK